MSILLRAQAIKRRIRTESNAGSFFFYPSTPKAEKSKYCKAVRPFVESSHPLPLFSSRRTLIWLFVWLVWMFPQEGKKICSLNLFLLKWWTDFLHHYRCSPVCGLVYIFVIDVLVWLVFRINTKPKFGKCSIVPDVRVRHKWRVQFKKTCAKIWIFKNIFLKISFRSSCNQTYSNHSATAAAHPTASTAGRVVWREPR